MAGTQENGTFIDTADLSDLSNIVPVTFHEFDLESLNIMSQVEPPLSSRTERFLHATYPILSSSNLTDVTLFESEEPSVSTGLYPQVTAYHFKPRGRQLPQDVGTGDSSEITLAFLNDFRDNQFAIILLAENQDTSTSIEWLPNGEKGNLQPALPFKLGESGIEVLVEPESLKPEPAKLGFNRPYVIMAEREQISTKEMQQSSLWQYILSKSELREAMQFSPSL